jgi:hypothetical protein
MSRTNKPRAHNWQVTQLSIGGGPKPAPSDQCPRHHLPIKPGEARCARGKKLRKNCR